MKKPLMLTTLITLLFITGCSTTTPSNPKPHPEKYALQVILIEIPETGTESTSAYTTVPTKTVDELQNNPEAVITEFPIVYAAVGETAINDQTEPLTAPYNYKLKTDTNGVISVIYENKTVKIGKHTEWTLQKIENGDVTGDLWFFDKSLAGSFTYEVAPATKAQDAVTATLPKFKIVEFKTKISLAPGSWVSMGGLLGGTAKNTQTAVEKHTFIRILPPQK